MRGRMLGVTMLLLASGCGMTGKAAETLRQRMAKLESEVVKLELELTRVKHTSEAEISRISSRLECHNEQVRSFIKACAEDSDVCTDEGIANALTFMNTQPYVVQYFRPKGTFSEESMALTRRGQIMTLTEISSWRPSTKFLVLVQPASDVLEDQKDALRLGGEIARYLREALVARKYPILGPKMLPCKLKREQLARYFRRNDLPVKGEPRENEPHIRAWIFKTDC